MLNGTWDARMRTGGGESRSTTRCLRSGTASRPNRGTAGAQERLGYAYAGGRGVVEDDVRAYMWLTLAVSRHLSSTPRLTQAFRDMLGGRFSPSQLATAQQLAQDWRPLTFEEAREVQPLPDAQMSFVECPPK